MLQILLLVVLPLVATLALPLAGRNPRVVARLPLLGALAQAVAFVAAFGAAPIQFERPFAGPFTLAFGFDGWRVLILGFVVVFAAMAGTALVSGIGRVARPRLVAASLLVAQSAAAGVVLADNVLLLLVFWEVFLLALYGAIHAGGENAGRVAFKALVIGGASDFLMILGLMLYLSLGGSPILGTPVRVEGSTTALVAFVLVVLGAGAKAGMVPFHTWIPEAAEAMPAPAFAAMPASLEKVLGVSFLYTACARMFVPDHRAQVIMLVLGLLTAYAVLVPALVERDLKRVLALTAIAPVGFMVAGMATGVAAGMAGALVYMLTHATYKSGMFLAAGAFEGAQGNTSLASVRGLGRRAPAVGIAFALAVAAAISLPPTGGYVAKELIFEGLVHHGWFVPLALFAVAAALLVAVMCKVLAVLWAPTGEARVALPAMERGPVVALGLLALLSGAAFAMAEPTFAAYLEAENPHFMGVVWHLGPLTLVSLAIWAAGAALFLLARRAAATPEETFAGLRAVPVVGRGLELAAAKRFDAYELGLKVLEAVAGAVFRLVDRRIDPLADGAIAGGAWFGRHALAAIHNGLYATYLTWAVAGLVLVVWLVLR